MEKTLCLHPVNFTSVHSGFVEATKNVAKQATAVKVHVSYAAYPKPVYTTPQKTNQIKKENKTHVKIFKQ